MRLFCHFQDFDLERAFVRKNIISIFFGKGELKTKTSSLCNNITNIRVSSSIYKIKLRIQIGYFFPEIRIRIRPKHRIQLRPAPQHCFPKAKLANHWQMLKTDLNDDLMRQLTLGTENMNILIKYKVDTK